MRRIEKLSSVAFRVADLHAQNASPLLPGEQLDQSTISRRYPRLPQSRRLRNHARSNLRGEITLAEISSCIQRRYVALLADHLAYLNGLRNTVHKISSGMLNKLTQLAVTKEPAVVREALIDLLADCASGSYPREDVETAALFFGRLSKLLIAKRDSATTRQDAKASLSLWIARTDPLHISRDPECGYRLAG